MAVLQFTYDITTNNSSCEKAPLMQLQTFSTETTYFITLNESTAAYPATIHHTSTRL